MTSSARPAPTVSRAVVACHGDLAAGLISAVHLISGRGDAFRALSNRDLGAVELEDLVREAVTAVDAKVVFTDLPAGSCTVAARRVARDVPGLIVVTGTNLSVLLAWVFAPENGAASCENAVERGHRGMAVFPGGAVQEGSGAH
ncbi:MAG: PTS sugar transporter subunit IIA [Gemmatimonadaceae bacterium]